MGLSSSLSNPFPKSGWASQRFGDACYLREFLGYAYEAETGLIVCGLDPQFPDKSRVSGSPAEVLLNPDFFMPQIGSIGDKVDLAFVLGALTAVSKDIDG